MERLLGSVGPLLKRYDSVAMLVFVAAGESKCGQRYPSVTMCVHVGPPQQRPKDKFLESAGSTTLLTHLSSTAVLDVSCSLLLDLYFLGRASSIMIVEDSFEESFSSCDRKG